MRFLRTENSYLRGQDLLKEIQGLPPLLNPINCVSTPSLEPFFISDSDDSDRDGDMPATPPTIRSLTTETKILYHDVIKFSSSPRVVDLASIYAKRADSNRKTGRSWIRKKDMPAYQVFERKLEADKLRKRVQGLLDRTSHF